MSKRWWQRARRPVQRLFRRERVAMDEEMSFHVAMEAEELIRTEGLEPEEARRRALVAFGSVESVKERARYVRSAGWLEDLVQDARLGVRSMRRAPGFGVVAGLTLALGVGATTAMFSVVSGVLLTPLPYPEADRLVAVWGRFMPESGFDFPEFPLSPPEHFDYAAQSEAVEDVAAYSGFRASLLDREGRAISVRGSSATANLFDVLRVEPALGRSYTEAEDVEDGPAVAVIGHGLWQRAFGGDPGILGRTIRVNGRTTEVIGVMPAGFAYPSAETELWVPIGLDPAQTTGRSSHFLAAVGRLSPGSDLARARSEMDALMARWKVAYPDVHTGHFLFLRPLLEQVVGSARAALLTLLGAVGFVLLIVCANVANLLLARGEARRRELAVRSALGAGRARLVRQYFAEGAVLSVVGGVAGLAIAYLLVDVTLALGAGSIPRAENVTVDERVLLFTATIALFTTLVFAIAPAVRFTVAEPRLALGSDNRTTTASTGLRLRQALVTAQVALAVMVVIGAGLMVRSFAELTTVDPGFRSGSVLVADLSLPAGDYPDPVDVITFYQDLLQRVEALPGVRTVAAANTLPLGGSASNIDFRIEGAPEPAPGEPAQSGDMIIADPGYPETIGVEVVEGRFFERGDRMESVPVVVVNRRLARMFWPGESAIGRRMRIASDGDAPWLEVVGVVNDVQFRTLAEDVRPAWYLPMTQMSLSLGQAARSFSIAVAVDGDPEMLAQPVRDVLRAADPALPVIRIRPLDRVIAESVSRPRFIMTVLGLFAALALVIGAVGIYGVLAYAVAQRTREFGIRMALGADRRQLIAIVAGQGFRLVLLGLAAGFAGALAGTRLIQGLLFNVRPTDPATFAAVTAVICLVALAASAVPVWRVLRADPVRALRAE